MICIIISYVIQVAAERHPYLILILRKCQSFADQHVIAGYTQTGRNDSVIILFVIDSVSDSYGSNGRTFLSAARLAIAGDG